jgi:polyribonucleotide nucleotidyltransferase
MAEVLKEGDKVKVKMTGFDKGKIRLSMKWINQETGEEMPHEEKPKKEHKEHKEKKAEEAQQQPVEELANILPNA